MAFNNTYNFTSQAIAESNWNFSDPRGTGLQSNNTAGRWSWHNGSTTSSNVGPDGGQGDAGYVYTEMSSSGVNGDVFIAELDQNFDASTQDITFSYYFGYRGDGNNGNIRLQSNENGAGWVNRGPAEILDQAGTGVGGTFQWLQKTVNLAGLISGNSTRFRLVITQGSAGTTWHKDVGLDTVNVVGTDSAPSNFTITGNASALDIQISNGTQANPNLASQLADAIIAAGFTNNAFRDGNLMWFSNIIIRSQRDSWFKWDEDGKIEIRNDFRSIPVNESSANANDAGSVIFGKKSVIEFKTGVFRVDSNCRPIGTGGALYFERTNNGVNPQIIKHTTNRNDYPTFAVANATFPREVIMEGLSYFQESVSGTSSSQKWYFGNSRNINGNDKFDNLDITGVGGEPFQTFNTVYQTPTVPNFIVSNDSTNNNVDIIEGSFGADGVPSAGFSGTFRSATISLDSPKFPRNPWNGQINSGFNSGSPRFFMVRFKNTIQCTDGINPIENVAIRITRSVRVAGSGYDLNALSRNQQTNNIDFTTSSNGTIERYLIDTLRARGTAGVANVNGTTESYNYTAKARAWDRTPNDSIYTNRNYGVGGLLGDGSDTFIMLIDDNITELDESVVQSFNIAENTNKVYDCTKERWVNDDDFVNDFPIQKEGDLFTTNLNVVLLASTNTNPVVFDNTTITIHTGGTFTGNITSTGTVTSTGVTVVGTITDVNGVRATGTLTLTGLENPSKVYLFNSALPNEDALYELDSQLATTGIYQYVFEVGDNITATVRIISLDERPIEFDVQLNQNREIPISQQQDRVYENN